MQTILKTLTRGKGQEDDLPFSGLENSRRRLYLVSVGKQSQAPEAIRMCSGTVVLDTVAHSG